MAHRHPPPPALPLSRLPADCDAQQAASSQRELRTLERTIFDIETRYLGAGSNLLTGWSDFARTLFVQAAADGAVSPEQRVFSLSSLTSPLGAAPWPRSLRAVLEAPRVVIVVNKSHKKQPKGGGAAVAKKSAGGGHSSGSGGSKKKTKKR